MLIYLLSFTIPLFTPFLLMVFKFGVSTYLKPVTTLQKRGVRIMTFSDPRTHSEPLLKSLRLLKFSDIIHLEILSFVYQWYHKISPSCFANYFNPVSSIHSYNTRQSQIDNLFVKSVHTTLLTLRKSSRFPVLVNISRILWLMVIILLLIPNVLRLYYLNYYLINEVILFI